MNEWSECEDDELNEVEEQEHEDKQIDSSASLV